MAFSTLRHLKPSFFRSLSFHSRLSFAQSLLISWNLTTPCLAVTDDGSKSVNVTALTKTVGAGIGIACFVGFCCVSFFYFSFQVSFLLFYCSYRLPSLRCHFLQSGSPESSPLRLGGATVWLSIAAGQFLRNFERIIILPTINCPDSYIQRFATVSTAFTAKLRVHA